MTKIKKNIRKIATVLYASIVMTCMQMSAVMAATDTNSVTKPLDNLKTLLLAVIGAVGVIILAKNVMEFAQAYQHNNLSMSEKEKIVRQVTKKCKKYVDWCIIWRYK